MVFGKKPYFKKHVIVNKVTIISSFTKALFVKKKEKIVVNIIRFMGAR